MASKKKQTKKPCKCGGKCSGKCCGNCYGPIYWQGHPTKKEREWLAEQSEYGKPVYVQAGRPPGGGSCLPGQPGCSPG